jgi:hypothetical protein
MFRLQSAEEANGVFLAAEDELLLLPVTGFGEDSLLPEASVVPPFKFANDEEEEAMEEEDFDDMEEDDDFDALDDDDDEFGDDDDEFDDDDEEDYDYEEDVDYEDYDE